MVKKRGRDILLKVYYDEMNSYEYLTEVLMQTLGYEITQAANCASIVIERGEYVVKSFKYSELEMAEAISELLQKHNIPAHLVEAKK